MKKSSTIPIFYILFITCFILNHKIYSQVIQSDDFNSATLNTSLWTFVDPLNDASYTMTGYNSGNASIDISVPAGGNHDIWTSGITAARIMQPAGDTDFEIEVKFESAITGAYQMQGILIEQEPGHVLRFDIYSDGTSVNLYGAIINISGSTPLTLYTSIDIGLPLPPYYLRVKRIGDDWNLTYSLDGIVWNNALNSGTSFNYAMTVSKVGVYSGNSPGTFAHTAVVDYFFNTANPIVPEDSDIPKITITPAVQSVNSNASVNLQVNIQGVIGLFASSITLEMDETLFEFSNISDGSFLESNSNGYDVLYQSLPDGNSYTDHVTVDQVILGRDAVDGSGLLYNIELIPLRSGNGKVKVKSFSLRDLDNNNIDANIDSAVVTINSPAPNIKVFLEGAYQTGAMTSLLPELGLLPLTQPFDTAPWNYTGFEKVDTDFYTDHPEIVDWVLIELRVDENTTVARRAAFINESGSLVDIDGVSPLSFFVNSAIQYYIVVRHRNHLDVMSSALIDVNFTSALYDFTVLGTNAYGTNAMKEVDTGIFAMYVGDGNNDNIINGTDFNFYNPLFKSGGAGYLLVDWSLDGIINGSDFNKFNPNFKLGLQSQVP